MGTVSLIIKLIFRYFNAKNYGDGGFDGKNQCNYLFCSIGGWELCNSNVLFIADNQNRQIATVDLTTNMKTRWAGISGNYQAPSGDGKAATDNSVGIMPTAFCGDTTGVVYITDNFWHRVRRVGTNSIISTFLGKVLQPPLGMADKPLLPRLTNPVSVQWTQWEMCMWRNRALM